MEWIVITSRSIAKIYEYTKEGKFHLLESHNNPLGRAKNFEMTEDKPGLSRAKFYGSPSPHGLSSENDPHEDAAEQFALTISKDLRSKIVRDSGLTLKVCAEAGMLGKIKSHLKEHHLQDKITWVEKDLQNVPQGKWKQILDLH